MGSRMCCRAWLPAHCDPSMLVLATQLFCPMFAAVEKPQPHSNTECPVNPYAQRTPLVKPLKRNSLCNDVYIHIGLHGTDKCTDA